MLWTNHPDPADLYDDTEPEDIIGTVQLPSRSAALQKLAESQTPQNPVEKPNFRQYQKRAYVNIDKFSCDEDLKKVVKAPKRVKATPRHRPAWLKSKTFASEEYEPETDSKTDRSMQRKIKRSAKSANFPRKDQNQDLKDVRGTNLYYFTAEHKHTTIQKFYASVSQDLMAQTKGTERAVVTINLTTEHTHPTVYRFNAKSALSVTRFGGFSNRHDSPQNHKFDHGRVYRRSGTFVAPFKSNYSATTTSPFAQGRAQDLTKTIRNDGITGAGGNSIVISNDTE